MKHKHTLSISVRNRFGALTRIAGLFSGRGYNIESLTVGPTDDPDISTMTIVTIGDDAIIEQITKQLNKLVDVISVFELTGHEFVAHELMLIKVQANVSNRSEIMQITDIFNASIVSIHKEALIIEVTGSTRKLDSFIELIHPFGIIELGRSGQVGLLRSTKPTDLIG
ncbi:MAG: acetolactate synthase small subunit [Verrucomicrobiota bacterium]|nr:acetolactate synthase small subunit [Verrucomicrobiota bacterium]